MMNLISPNWSDVYSSLEEIQEDLELTKYNFKKYEDIDIFWIEKDNFCAIVQRKAPNLYRVEIWENPDARVAIQDLCSKTVVTLVS